MTTPHISLPMLAALTVSLSSAPILAQDANTPATPIPVPVASPARAAIPATPLTPASPTPSPTASSLPASHPTSSQPQAKQDTEVPVSVSASAVSRDGRTVTASAQCRAVSDGNGPSDVSDSSTVTSEDGSVTVSVSCRAAADRTPHSYYSYKSTTTVIRSGPVEAEPAPPSQQK